VEVANMMKIEVRSSQFPYDMGPWLTEKSQNILQELALLYDECRKRNDLPEELKNNLEEYLSGIFWDCTKILSFASGGTWDTEDRDIIIGDGLIGLERILVKYGLKSETTEDRHKRVRGEKKQTLIAQLEELLNEPRGVETRVNELLFKEGYDDPIIKEMIQMTEQRSRGEITWDEYRNLITELIRRLKKGTE
jgi:hypothetical protein